MKAETKYIKGVKYIILPFDAFDILVGKVADRLDAIKRQRYQKQMVSYVRKEHLIENNKCVIPITIKSFLAIKNLLDTEETI